MMFVICTNDYPTACAETEEAATKCKARLDKKYKDEDAKASGALRCRYVHIREVPLVTE